MTHEPIRKWGGAVPRYTSYPTAPHFSAAVGAETYGDWLASLDPETALSVYSHIPFCDTLCWFCGCHTKITRRYDVVARYVDYLVREIDLVAQRLDPGVRIHHVHWGGGSPTLLSPEDIERLSGALFRAIERAEGYEFAVEVDPRDIADGTVRALGKAGVTRASLGVQDFHPEVQKAINRIQSYEVTFDVVHRLRDAGIRDINLDLMYGLPFQTEERVLESVEKALSLDPDRLALFGYAHVPWMKTHQKMIDEAALPDLDARFRQAESAAERLVSAGYVRIGLDHFAKREDPMAIAERDGILKRNFQGYTTDRAAALVGFGASAIGRLPQGYIQNDPSLHAYRRAIDADTLPVAKGHALSADDRLRADIIERVMCDFAVDVAAVARSHGTTPEALADALPYLQALEADGLIRRDGWRIAATDRGRPFIRHAAAAFDSYFHAGRARHSTAV